MASSRWFLHVRGGPQKCMAPIRACDFPRLREAFEGVSRTSRNTNSLEVFLALWASLRGCWEQERRMATSREGVDTTTMMTSNSLETRISPHCEECGEGRPRWKVGGWCGHNHFSANKHPNPSRKLRWQLTPRNVLEENQETALLPSSALSSVL